MSEHSQATALDADGIDYAALAWTSRATSRSTPWISRSLLLVFALLCLQSALFLVFATDHCDIRTFLILHLTLCAGTATFGRWWIGAPRTADGTDDTTATVLQLAAWTAVAGPFGAVVAGALLVPRSAAANHAVATADADSPTDRPGLTRLELLHRSLLDNRLRLERAHAIRPLLDVIIEGAQTEKFDALSLISKRYNPALAPALKRALEDKDASVRVLAATVMAQQNNASTKRIGALQAVARAQPETSRHWCELGQAHFDYAVSGLLEASRAKTEASQALAHLVRAAELDPSDAVTQARLNVVRRFVAYGEQPAVATHDTPNAREDRVKPHAP
jgi:hypothetical protein